MIRPKRYRIFYYRWEMSLLLQCLQQSTGQHLYLGRQDLQIGFPGSSTASYNGKNYIKLNLEHFITERVCGCSNILPRGSVPLFQLCLTDGQQNVTEWRKTSLSALCRSIRLTYFKRHLIGFIPFGGVLTWASEVCN